MRKRGCGTDDGGVTQPPLPSASETAAALSGDFLELELLPLHAVDGDKETLCEAVATLHGDRLIGDVAELEAELILRTMKILIDDANRVREHESALHEARPSSNEEDVALRHLHDEVRREQDHFIGLDGRIHARGKVKRNRARRLVRWEW